MTRMPVLNRDEMDDDQQRVHDEILATTGRVGKGPAVGYAYSPGLWENHNASSAHLNKCSLTQAQVRTVSLMTARHWNAAYPWSAQAGSALAAGIDPAVVEAMNAGQQPDFADSADQMVHAAARELLSSGTLGDEIFKQVQSTIGLRCLADIVGVIGHFCTTSMMANVAGAEPSADAPSRLKI